MSHTERGVVRGRELGRLLSRCSKKYQKHFSTPKQVLRFPYHILYQGMIEIVILVVNISLYIYISIYLYQS